MALQTPTPVTVTTAATLIATPTGGTSYDPTAITLYNASSTVVVYLGGSDVTAAAGVPLAALGTVSFTLSAENVIYGITSSSTASVRILQVG